MRDLVLQGAPKRSLELICEGDYHDGSCGYRPRRTAQLAVDRVAEAIVRHKTRGIDVDLVVYFDRVRHGLRRAKVAHRVHDREILHVLKLILQAFGTRGLAQGGVISPLLSHMSLTEVDARLDRAQAGTRNGEQTDVESVHDADDLVRLVYHDHRQDWLNHNKVDCITQ
jgi:RNA-directed DNA polymerase